MSTIEEDRIYIMEQLEKLLDEHEQQKKEIHRYRLRHPIRYRKWRRSPDGRRWLQQSAALDNRLPVNMIH